MPTPPTTYKIDDDLVFSIAIQIDEGVEITRRFMALTASRADRQSSAALYPRAMSLYTVVGVMPLGFILPGYRRSAERTFEIVPDWSR